MSGHPSSPPDYSILAEIRPIDAPPKTSWLYTINMLVVTVAMILLPLIYLALVGLAAYGVYYHAAHHASWFTGLAGRSGRGAVGALIIYLIPLVVGIVVVFFMIKPIFAGRPKRAQPLALNPADNPLLFAFIEKIAETVGAPSPRRIDLNCDLNASAGFRRGYLSMFGNDLVLTIGLPLVANLSAAEFGGVVAHEFGHFTQSLGMRLSYIIRSINLWFMRVVYERDSWDESLEDWAENIEDGRVAIIVWTAQLGVFFARLILRVLMYLGWLIGGFMLRQMEYDADAWEIKLAGSETFERTQRKLATLSAAMEKMYQQIHGEWKKTQQLPDNISELLRQHHNSLSPDTLQKIEDASGLERTGWFDSHPSLADRIRAARRAQEPGVFHDERPAAALFSSFDHPARFVTLLHYTDDLEIPVSAPMLLRVEPQTPAATARPGSPAQATTAARPETVVDEYLFGIAAMVLPLKIPPVTPSLNYEADMTELLQLTESLQAVRSDVELIGVRYGEAIERRLQARTARQLLHAGVTIAGETYGLVATSETAAQEAEAEADAARATLQHSAHEVIAALQRRLQLGLSLQIAAPHTGKLTSEEMAAALERNESSAAQFCRSQELVEALEVYDRLAALRETAGSPELERAQAAQLEFVRQFQPALVEAAAPAPAPALQLKVNRVKPVDRASVKQLQRETQQWLAGYRANLNQLLDTAQTVEGIHG